MYTQSESYVLHIHACIHTNKHTYRQTDTQILLATSATIVCVFCLLSVFGACVLAALRLLCVLLTLLGRCVGEGLQRRATVAEESFYRVRRSDVSLLDRLWKLSGFLAYSRR